MIKEYLKTDYEILVCITEVIVINYSLSQLIALTDLHNTLENS